jgi:nitrite reductase/ring-hydroxylating ferredoxin subunit
MLVTEEEILASWKQVLREGDLAEGERRVVEVDDRPLLLVQHQGEIYAVARSCPHLRLSLERGTITDDGAIVCPWHHSAFDLESGDVKEWSPWPPGLGRVLGTVSREKTLTTFPTRREDGHIWVNLSR